MTQVKTFDGTNADKSNCRKIKGAFYEMNKQCFLMPDGKWHRINNGKIVKNYDNEEYVFISDDLENGIVGKELDGSIKTGFFTKDLSKNVLVNTGNDRLRCLKRSIAEEMGRERIGDGEFYLESKQNDEFFERKQITRKYENERLEYRCDSKMKITTKAFDKFFIGKPLKHGFHKMLPPVSFGVEYETENGRISQDLMMQSGLIPVRDGSLRNDDGTRPYEYATVILDGKTGLQAISKQCDLLNHYCTQSYRNSLHIHIGGIPITKEYVVATYKIVKQLQDEVYEMFPEAMRNTRLFKNQDYCSPLKGFRFQKDDVEFNFNKIYKHLAMDDEAVFSKFKDPHPRDPGNNSKWNVKSRYSICNLVTTIFGSNGTVEWRIHTSTFNKDKIVNWLYIISAISWYAYLNKDKDSFNKLTLEEVIESIYPSSIIRDYLKDYIKYRKDLMRSHKEKKDIYGQLDVENDNLSEFKPKIKSLIEHE